MPVFTEVTPDNPLHKRIRHTRSVDFFYEEQSQGEDDTPYDYTGHSFEMEIKELKGDDSAVVTIPDSSFSISASSEGASAGVNDKFTIEHPPADFSDLLAEPFEYYFDIQITDAAGKKFTPIVGEFIVVDD